MILFKIAGHPLMQLFSFCILLVGSPYFGGPYIFFLYHAVQELYAYAIFGWMAIALVLCALFFTGRGEAVLQFIGAVLMVVSLAVFVFSSEHGMNSYVWRQLLPLVTLALSGCVAGVVVCKFIKAGGL